MKKSTSYTELKKLSDSLAQTYDLFICSGSYEERSKSIPSQFSKETFTEIFICFNKDHENIVGQSAKEIGAIFGDKSTYVELSSANQIDIADTFLGKIYPLLKTNQTLRILLDISTFKRQTLLILLRVLRSVLTPQNKLTFVYSPAGEYSIGLPDEEKWLSKNITEVHSILGFSGILLPTKSIHLIILVGLEFERALSLINEYEPAVVSIGYPSEASSKGFKHHELNKKKVELIREEHPHCDMFEFDCTDVVSTKEALDKQIEKYKTYNSIISPMNNKLSTLAVALTAFSNKSVQVAYASAAFYNVENYSTPSTHCFIIELDDFIKPLGFA